MNAVFVTFELHTQNPVVINADRIVSIKETDVDRRPLQTMSDGSKDTRPRSLVEYDAGEDESGNWIVVGEPADLLKDILKAIEKQKDKREPMRYHG